MTRRFHNRNLCSIRITKLRCVPFSLAHQTPISMCRQEHKDWTQQEWGKVLFMDESRFSLTSYSGRIHIWIELGTCSHLPNIIESDLFSDAKDLIWSGIMCGSLTNLHVLQGVQSLVCAILHSTFFTSIAPCFTCVCLKEPWVLASSWTTMLHPILHWLLQNSYRVKIFNAWIDLQSPGTKIS